MRMSPPVFPVLALSGIVTGRLKKRCMDARRNSNAFETRPARVGHPSLLIDHSKSRFIPAKAVTEIFEREHSPSSLVIETGVAPSTAISSLRPWQPVPPDSDVVERSNCPERLQDEFHGHFEGRKLPAKTHYSLISPADNLRKCSNTPELSPKLLSRIDCQIQRSAVLPAVKVISWFQSWNGVPLTPIQPTSDQGTNPGAAKRHAIAWVARRMGWVAIRSCVIVLIIPRKGHASGGLDRHDLACG